MGEIESNSVSHLNGNKILFTTQGFVRNGNGIILG